MRFVKLLPTTKRLKQVIKDHGEVWMVVEERSSVPCFSGERGLFIEAANGWHQRWVKPSDTQPIVGKGA